MNNEVKEILAYFEKYVKTTYMHDSEPMLNWKDLKIVLDYITNLQEQLHQASLDIQELTERDIECPSWCDKLTNLQQENNNLKTSLDESQEVVIDLQERIEKATNELFELKDMIYKPETRDENIPIQQKISSIIKQLNGRSDE